MFGKTVPVTNFLTARQWEQIHGEEYENWRKLRWKNSDSKTKIFLEHLFPMGKLIGGREKRLLPHQAETLQRVIYSFEQHKLQPLLATLATGTGKTVIIASVMAWLLSLRNRVDTILLLCPNTIVRDRLKRDFEGLNVFKEFPLLPKQDLDLLSKIQASIVEEHQNCTNLMGKQILVSNRHQFQRGYSGGQDHLAFLKNYGGNLAVFNDEAHNTRGKEYDRTLELIQPQTVFRLDLTATPDRADEKRPKSHEIYELSVSDAMTGGYKSNRFFEKSYEKCPPLIKSVVVNRPKITSLEIVEFGDLPFQDLKTGQKLNHREIGWDEWPSNRMSQIVMDPGPMKLQLKLAINALDKKIQIAKGRFKPLLFVIAPSIAGAESACKMLKEEFGKNPLIVVDDASEYEKADLRKAASELGSQESPYDSVVSVYMLREGWDVPEVSVTCLLRGFGSKLFAHQVIGRGLRLIRRNGLESDRAVQELTVIDHECLGLDELWKELNAKIITDGEVVEPQLSEITSEDESDEPDPEQQIVNSELLELLQVPDCIDLSDINLPRALELLEKALDTIRDYDLPTNVITGVKTEGFTRLRPNHALEEVSEPQEVSVPKIICPEHEKIQNEFCSSLREWAHSYAQEYSPFDTYEEEVYRRILYAFEHHLFNNASPRILDSHTLFYVQNLIPQIQEWVTHELNSMFYCEANQNE